MKLEILERLVKDPDISTELKGNALIKAAEAGHLETVEAILKEKSIAIAVEHIGWALRMASWAQHPEIVERLLKEALPAEDKGKALQNALMKDDLEIVRLLLEADAKAQSTDKIPKEARCWAIEWALAKDYLVIAGLLQSEIENKMDTDFLEIPENVILDDNILDFFVEKKIEQFLRSLPKNYRKRAYLKMKEVLSSYKVFAIVENR